MVIDEWDWGAIHSQTSPLGWNSRFTGSNPAMVNPHGPPFPVQPPPINHYDAILDSTTTLIQPLTRQGTGGKSTRQRQSSSRSKPMNRRSRDNAAFRMLREAREMHGSLQLYFRFLRPPPAEEKIQHLPFKDAIMRVARWNLKCQRRLERHATELRTIGNLIDVESTTEAIKYLALGLNFETKAWGDGYQELRGF